MIVWLFMIWFVDSKVHIRGSRLAPKSCHRRASPIVLRSIWTLPRCTLAFPRYSMHSASLTCTSLTGALNGKKLELIRLKRLQFWLLLSTSSTLCLRIASLRTSRTSTKWKISSQTITIASETNKQINIQLTATSIRTISAIAIAHLLKVFISSFAFVAYLI